MAKKRRAPRAPRNDFVREWLEGKKNMSGRVHRDKRRKSRQKQKEVLARELREEE